MKQWQKILPGLLLAFLLSGCMSLSESGPAQQFYVLNDTRVSTISSSPRPDAKIVLLSTSAGSPFYDSVRLAFSQQPSARAYYQFANWTTRPSVRLGQLLAQRLNVQGKVNAAWLSSDIAGDWLLDIRVDEFYHDVSVMPGQARLIIQAELLDRRTQKIKASRVFYLQADAKTNDATGAVAAFQTATTIWLDQVVVWVEQVLQ
ncbi:MAG: ABC-type transport auxiliary lipoprotein family protein [Burkholderiaceae bacterium]